MRIRSIRPEFWTSEDIASLTWDQRLIYIGLWSYVDDNGVGRDVEKLIAADLFPLEESPQAVLKKIQGALSEYSKRQMITRYRVDNKPYLHITAWERHQKINRPSEGRYPLPTRGDAVIQDALTDGSVSPHADVALGEGEKGRRGEGEKASIDAAFDTWYSIYPKKVGRPAALAAYKKAAAKASADVLLSGARVMAKAYAADKTYCPNPATWLNQERWNDDPPASPGIRAVDSRPASLAEAAAYYETPAAPDADSLPWAVGQ